MKKAAGGWKGSAIGAAAGAGVYYLDKEFLAEQDFIKENWYARGAALAVGGHFLKQKPGMLGQAGMAALVMGGYFLAKDHDEKAESSEGVSSNAGDVTDRVFGSPGDAGALYGGGPVAGVHDMAQPDAGALQNDYSVYEAATLSG